MADSKKYIDAIHQEKLYDIGSGLYATGSVPMGRTANGDIVPVLLDASGKIIFSGVVNATISEIEGKAAHDDPASGKPLQVGGVYRSADPNVANGDVASLRVNQKGEAIVQLSGSKMELYGATVATRPAATSVAAGTTFTIVDDTQDFKTWMSNGVDWGEEI